ncbi:dDENN domain protein [Aspergillus aculeatinus CBS 121060]|uniref:DDENN domain protein n=1 Tax=Aspergillus aculeatinus CBS 121060 TaxID=1448322 RepID=A0ACD1HM21_9EURO|nr:dDENN domain protein [Aspergillus aculeatinus CBS 121060]RAH74621.1 dDENN domain protein [Aspergillus aculeatinus CBS 121060]
MPFPSSSSASSSTPEASTTPLADYFWIAGVDGTEVLETYRKLGDDYRANCATSPGPAVTDTIEEDADAEEAHDPRLDSLSRPISMAGNRNSVQRVSTRSGDADANENGSHSNRSSMTIKGNQSPRGSSFLGDFDFDKALWKFASERESFLSDLNVSAGAITPSTRPRSRLRTQKIVSEEGSQSTGLIRSSIGSVRRHMAFRDMNSMKRQPSIARQASIRTSRRLSNYNSVIPVPQPLEISPTMHPLKRRFEPVLLDRYPTQGMSDELKLRGNFPDYVPMFAFPNDINIVSSDQRPRSTWHGFVMTTDNGSRLHAICLIIWIPLNQKAADELEKRCEEWRKENMTDEERELAASLGERLASERAKLSRLLAQLPTVPSGSESREQLEDEISAVEEKIGLMTDLLRPVRHGAASKIEGLTDGDTGFWIPRAYGILGREENMTSFWKEWLKAVVVPMTDGGIQRIPPSSPRMGVWQPLERYVMNLCTEAFSPNSSKTQVELNVRELRLFARKEASNELPGSRNTDIYALFRALSLANIVILLEYALTESRIIFLSSHTSMLYLATKALVDLLFPIPWSGVLIPVLPARLIQALEAPCPYIVGIERRYEKVELPSDDFVLVDLDADLIESTVQPTPLPRHQRRKLLSLLQLAAPHHSRCGVPTGPPAYAVETYPFDAFMSENSSIFTSKAQSTHLAKYVSLNSSAFGQNSVTPGSYQPLIFNAYLHARYEQAVSRGYSSKGSDRPGTGSTYKTGSPPSPRDSSPTSGHFPASSTGPGSRNDSGSTLQASLREKRSGHFDAASRRSSSFGMEMRPGVPRRPSAPFIGHASNLSVTTLNTDYNSGSTYAPSVYAQSTVAASTIVPTTAAQPVHNAEGTCWVEGHCLQVQPWDEKAVCAICDDRAEDGMYKCSACKVVVHSRCALQICLVCPAAFHPEQVRAAFVRCFASLFYTYKKFLQPASGDKKKAGLIYSFNMEAFMKSLPGEHAEYIAVLQQTQGFNEFIGDRERANPKSRDPRMALFDEIILSKRNRGRSSIFSGRSTTDFLSDTSNHLWRTASATSFAGGSRSQNALSGDYTRVVMRAPAKLDTSLMKEPRMVHGAPRVSKTANNARRKPLPKLMNGLAISPP